VGNLTLGDSDAVHCYPTQQKYIEPDVEDPGHVEVVVLSPYAVVDPGTVSFVAINTFIAHVTVHCSLRLDHFAVGA
jgi:hypothetical protein